MAGAAMSGRGSRRRSGNAAGELQQAAPCNVKDMMGGRGAGGAGEPQQAAPCNLKEFSMRMIELIMYAEQVPPTAPPSPSRSRAPRLPRRAGPPHRASLAPAQPRARAEWRVHARRRGGEGVRRRVMLYGPDKPANRTPSHQGWTGRRGGPPGRDEGDAPWRVTAWGVSAAPRRGSLLCFTALGRKQARKPLFRV